MAVAGLMVYLWIFSLRIKELKLKKHVWLIAMRIRFALQQTCVILIQKYHFWRKM